MADAILSVELQAKVDAFVKGLLDAANSAENTEKSVNNLSKSVSQNVANINRVNFSAFQNALKQNQISITGFNNSIGKLPKELPKIVTGSNRAALALSNLGRVAQDAPFGFIGIQNNLNPLLESFQALQKETGSTSATLKSLASGLTGAGGIGLALSVVSSLYLLYAQYSQKASKADEEKAKNTKSAKEALDDYIGTLDAKTRADVKGLENSQKDLIQLRQLYDASRNLKIPLEERIKAAQELIDQYPQTFKNFSAEQIALGKASAAYKQLSTDIIATAKAAARTDILVENEKEIVQLNEKRKQLEKQLKSQKEIDARAKEAAKNANNIGGSTLGGTTDFSGDLTRAANQTSKTLDLTTQINGVSKQITSKRYESLGIEKEITGELVKQKSVVSITGIDTDKGKKEKELKSLSEILADLQIELKQNDLAFDDTFNEKRINDIDSYQKAINELVKNGFSPASDAVKNLISVQNKLAETVRGGDLRDVALDVGKLLGISSKPFTIQPKLTIKPIVTGVAELTEFAEAAQAEIDKILSLPELLKRGSAVFADAFEAMGASIANGGDVLAAAGGVLQAAFAQLLSQLGQQFILKGAALIAAGLAEASNPLTALAGAANIRTGAALTALGAGLALGGGLVGATGKGKSGGGNVTAFANGGIISGPTLGLMGEYAGAKSDPEVVAPLSKLKKLLGQQDENGNPITSSKDSGVYVQQKLEIQGTKLVAMIEKVEASNRRKN